MTHACIYNRVILISVTFSASKLFTTYYKYSIVIIMQII